MHLDDLKTRLRSTLLPSALSLAASLFALATGVSGHAQHLPPAAPTAAPAPSSITVPQAFPAPVSRSQAAPTRARVQVRNGMATVVADNSSLNQILRELADRAGITITGGVADERVFGNYGPADVNTLLNQLLEGTGTNILLLESATHRPRELVLTPRGGGPSPPSPPAAAQPAEEDDRDDRDTPPQETHFVDRRLVPEPTPPAAPPVPTTPAAAAPPAAPADTTQQSPNGVKTPQQIYEQLLKMQQTPAPAKPN